MFDKNYKSAMDHITVDRETHDKILDSIIIGLDGYYSYNMDKKLDKYYEEICENNKDLFKENHITLNK